jgi:hypothetical protein
MLKFLKNFMALLTIFTMPAFAEIKIEIGIDANSYNYLEPKIMQMKGTGSGVFLVLSERKEYWTGAFEVQFNRSNLNYTSNGTGELDDITDTLKQWRLTMTRHTDTRFAGWSPSLYAGWAMRNNQNDFQGLTTTGAQAYRRSNQRSYLPLGITFTRSADSVDSGDEWFISAELRPVLSGKHTTRLTDVGASEDNTSQQTGKGWALQAQRNWGPWRLTAYTNQWDMKATERWQSKIDGITYSFREPANKTRETGLRFSRLF